METNGNDRTNADVQHVLGVLTATEENLSLIRTRGYLQEGWEERKLIHRLVNWCSKFCWVVQADRIQEAAVGQCDSGVMGRLMPREAFTKTFDHETSGC